MYRSAGWWCEVYTIRMATHKKLRRFNSMKRPLVASSTSNVGLARVDNDEAISDNETYELWYRHSGEAEIHSIPRRPPLKNKTLQDIICDTERFHITHMMCSKTIPPLRLLAPQLLHLKIECLVDPSHLCRISYLSKLGLLELSNSDFSNGLQVAITELDSLRILRLRYCHLTDLPDWLVKFEKLKILNLSGNNFLYLPSVIFNLDMLEVLEISHNYQLERLTDEILKLSKLLKLACVDCPLLVDPPYGVCQQGILAVKRFFADFKLDCQNGRARGGPSIVPVAIVGQKMAGKTSLVRSLKAGKRKLTDRTECYPIDETTKAFHIVDLKLANSHAKLVDHGGHEVYHVAYQYILKENNVPLIVVSLEEFAAISAASGPKEATRKVCWDWLCHLYLACPLLEAPLLILTHVDRLPHVANNMDAERCKRDILEKTEQIRREMLTEEQEQCGPNRGSLRNVTHLSNKDVPIFHSDDIFLFSNETSETLNIERLKDSLDKRCGNHGNIIPLLWEKVNAFVDSHEKAPFIALSEMKSKNPDADCEVIARYMHNTGSVLWFEHIESLKPYIFHQIPSMAAMIAVLFHHRAEEQWMKRLDTFTGFRQGDQMIGKDKYEELYQEFITHGVMDEAILVHLLKTESDFPPDLALELLKCFFIVHGPINHTPRNKYIMPYFARNSMDNFWKRKGFLQLRLDIGLGGLSLPMYGYQHGTVAVLNTLMSPFNSINVKKDGVTVHHGTSSTNLVHFYDERKITLQVSTEVEQLGNSWKHFLGTARAVLDALLKVCKVCRPSLRFYCIHCLFLRNPQPAFQVDPDWFLLRHSTDGEDRDVQMQPYTGVDVVPCKRELTSRPTVPKPLKFPCYSISSEETQVLKAYLSSVEHRRIFQLEEVMQCQPSAPLVYNDDADSVLSDDLYWLDEEQSLASIKLRVTPCSKKKITSLFCSDSVYRMSHPIRGRCLIINNFTFSGAAHREGSEVDGENITAVFDALSFDCGPIHQDLSSKSMLEVLREETKHPDHKSYGMFVLVIMTHGSENHLQGSDGEEVKRTDITDSLCPERFPAMAGKPKLVILHACSGKRQDKAKVDNTTSCSRTSDNEPSSTPSTSHSSLESGIATGSNSSCVTATPPPPDCLAWDDFFILRPSVLGYVSMRHDRHGSWFIRALVEALYQHCCHRDIKTLFEEQVTKKVRKKSIQANKVHRNVSRQQPTIECYPTGGRKLYLFPGYVPTR